MFFYIILSAFIISFIIVPFAMILAHNKNAIALPGGRHIHVKPTPKFGGIAIAISVFMISPFVFSLDRVIGSYLASSGLMLLLGIIDDVKGTGWRTNFVFSITATAVFIVGSNIWITTLGNLLGSGEIHLGLLGIPFTFFAVFGIVNAVNLIDGLNGLACGVSSIAFMSFAVFASVSGNSTVLYLSLANLGATLGLIRYNYPGAKIFMGNSGSLFLGFSMAVLSILLTQGDGAAINPMVPVVILGIPIFDTVRVMTIRIMNRRHPFKADRRHLHHLMIRSGIPVSRAVKLMWLMSAVMSIAAFMLFKREAWQILAAFCIIVLSIGIFIKRLKIIRATWKTKKNIPAAK